RDRRADAMTLWASAPYTADSLRVFQTFLYKVMLSASSSHSSACQSSATTSRSSSTQKPLAGTILTDAVKGTTPSSTVSMRIMPLRRSSWLASTEGGQISDRNAASHITTCS